MSSTTVDRSPLPAAALPDAPKGRRANPWLTLIAVAIGLFMVNLDSSVVAIANPETGRDLGASTADLQWVTNAYLIAMAALLILGGKLGDRFGRHTVYLVGTLTRSCAPPARRWPGSACAVAPGRRAWRTECPSGARLRRLPASGSTRSWRSRMRAMTRSRPSFFAWRSSASAASTGIQSSQPHRLYVRVPLSTRA